MVLSIGLDDTDSLRGMCTTFLLTEVVRQLRSEYDVIGYPRLVRLNPNIPWKTRGNGALCLRIGQGQGRPSRIGEIGGAPVLSYPRCEEADEDRTVLGRVSALIEQQAVLDDPTTNPGVVVLERRPSPSLYWRAVREVVPLRDALAELAHRGTWRGYKNRRGLIGAAAAVAWRPRDRTYELLAYRPQAAWGTGRSLDAESVKAMDLRFPCTFNNIEAATGHVAIAPHSPCPVLYGVRGDHAVCLPKAQETLRGERPERWLIFETNQGTDDHIVMDDWSLRPATATSVEGQVAGPPRTLPGGHTIVPFRGRGTIDLAFYEPSKDFRSVGRSLIPGDGLRVWGSIRRDGRSLNVEKICVETLAQDRVRVANPVCPTCGKSMKSAGRNLGFRCAERHARAPATGGTWVVRPRSITPGWYEPPAYARRHLSMPLRRIKSGHGGPRVRALDASSSPAARPRARESAASAR